MQIDRLFQIVHILIEQKKITAKDLAERFSVSTRTIYRDIDTLSINGIPIITTKGKQGGISLMDHFVMDKSVLTKEERSSLKLGLETLQLTNGQEEKKALEKLRSLFNYEEEAWIKVDFSHWGNDPKEILKFEHLKQGIIHKYQVKFGYYDKEGLIIERQVMPHQLLFKERNWYLIAYCTKREAFRTFKISRMTDLVLLEDHFIRKPLPEYMAGMTNTDTREAILYKLRIHQNKSYRIMDEFDKDHIKKEGDYFIIDYLMADDGGLFEYLMSYGADLEIIEPVQARDEMKKRLANIIDVY